MNYKKPLFFILFCSITIWLLSTLFTALTFSPEVDVVGDPDSYDNVIRDNCDEKEITKNIQLTFRYKYPLVHFKGKLDVFNIHPHYLNQTELYQREKQLLYSGPAKRNIIIEGLCFNPNIENTHYRNLQFVFSDKSNVYWFSHQSDDKNGFPFLKYKKLNILIDSFSIHPAKPYQVKTIE